jgi:hypothetical protein
METMNKPEGKANTIWRIQFNRDFTPIANEAIIKEQLAAVVRTVDDHFDSWVDANRNDPDYPNFYEEYSTMRNILNKIDSEREDVMEMIDEAYIDFVTYPNIDMVEDLVIETLQPIIDAYNEALNLM